MDAPRGSVPDCGHTPKTDELRRLIEDHATSMTKLVLLLDRTIARAVPGAPVGKPPAGTALDTYERENRLGCPNHVAVVELAELADQLADRLEVLDELELLDELERQR